MSQLTVEIDERVFASVVDMARQRSTSVDKTVEEILAQAVSINAIDDALSKAVMLGRKLGKSSDGGFLSRDEANGTA